MADVHDVDAWLTALLSRFTPAERKRILREVAQQVRKSQQKAMTQQQAPDGTAWAPRRPQLRSKQGRIKRKMFVKLKNSRNLKATATDDTASIGFRQEVQRIARVHHYGLRDRVRRRGPVVKYPARPLIGINQETASLTRDILLRWLSE